MGHWFYERNYGADIDGNRGVNLRCFEVDPEDSTYIKEKIHEYMVENDIHFVVDLPEQITIRFIDPISEDDVDIEITIKDYL